MIILSPHDSSISLREEEKTIRRYFHDIGEFKPLSQREEAELGARIQNGDTEARDILVRVNLRFVVEVAKHYQNRGLSLADLISSGNLGLMEAAGRFDGTKGYKFISYAVWWIKQAILQTIAEHARTVRLPLNKLNELKKISEAARELSQGNEQDPTPEEIAKHLDLSVEEVENTVLTGQLTVSLDKKLKERDDSPRTLLNSLPDPQQEIPDKRIDQESVRKDITKCLECLKKEERTILIRYFGLDGEEPQTLDAIGKLMGVSRERIRQIKEKTLQKLRHPKYAKLWRAVQDAHQN